MPQSKNYSYIIDDQQIKIVPSKISLLRNGIIYSVLISVAIYYIVALNDFKNNISQIAKIIIAVGLSIPIAFVISLYTGPNVKIRKEGNKVYFEKCELFIEEILEIRLEEYISSEVATGISSIYFVTKIGKYKIVPAVPPEDVDTMTRFITTFIGVNTDIIKKVSF